jgi:malate dehydrogenase (oxaloacetate-decarboxylating)(NADP+)
MMSSHDGAAPPPGLALNQEQALAGLRALATPLERYVQLARLHGEDYRLFYRLLIDHLEELMPVVYTPTVGDACLAWSRLPARPRGLYVSRRDRGRIAQVLRGWPRRDVGFIVVTDGGRILGLGDLGANGMGIPVGKLALYTACGGVPPQACLPVMLDVGTDNEAVRGEPGYLGVPEPRLKGEAWDALLEEFVAAVEAVFPQAVLQFEDFNNACAFALLARYRERRCCFNDDIQGTGAMGLAGLLAAGRITGRKLGAQRLLFAGAGEAGLGIGATVLAAMREEGLSEAQARERCLFMDSRGAVVAGRRDLAPHKRPFARDRAPIGELAAAVEIFRPTALIGASAQAGLFGERVLSAMAQLNERPVVFALSNPTSKSECTAEQAYAWTGGRALFASGSPFAPVEVNGRSLVPAQGNNAWIFPGLGLGLGLSGARRVTDQMFLAAAQALAAQMRADEIAQGRLFPPAARLRPVAAAVAAAVAAVAYEQAHATRPRPRDLYAAALAGMYEPRAPA